MYNFKDLKCLVFVCLLILYPDFVQSQFKSKQDSLYYFVKFEKEMYLGQLVDSNSKELRILARNKMVIILPTKKVESLKLADVPNSLMSKIVNINRNPSYYFISPSAIPIKRSSYNYNMSLLFFNLQYGITNKISVGIGVPVILLPIALNARYSEPLGKYLHVGLGIRGMYTPSFWGINASYGYASATLGNAEYNLTYNIGYGWYDGFSLSDKGDPQKGDFIVHSLSANLRIDNSLSFMSDVQYFDRYGAHGIACVSGFRIWHGGKFSIKTGLAAMVTQRTVYTYDYYKNVLSFRVLPNSWYPYWVSFFGLNYQM